MKAEINDIINEFRNLSNFITNDEILLENLNTAIKKYIPNCAIGLFFNKPDAKAVNELHIYTNSKTNFNLLKEDFFKEISIYKEIVKNKVIPHIDTITEETYSNGLIIPFMFEQTLLGAVGLYFSINTPRINERIFNFLVEECLRVFKLKYLFNEQIYKSTIDGLTGLYNRHQFDIDINKEYNRAERYQSPFSVAMLDIDFFKKFNDNYGHQFGDYVLKEVSNIINSTLRKTDIVYRYGGEEIVVIMPETSLESAKSPIEKLRKTVQNYNFNNKNVTVSIGLAQYRGQASPSDIIKQADNLLYKAKQNGRNKVCS